MKRLIKILVDGYWVSDTRSTTILLQIIMLSYLKGCVSLLPHKKQKLR